MLRIWVASYGFTSSLNGIRISKTRLHFHLNGPFKRHSIKRRHFIKSENRHICIKTIWYYSKTTANRVTQYTLKYGDSRDFHTQEFDLITTNGANTRMPGLGFNPIKPDRPEREHTPIHPLSHTHTHTFTHTDAHQGVHFPQISKAQGVQWPGQSHIHVQFVLA